MSAGRFVVIVVKRRIAIVDCKLIVAAVVIIIVALLYYVFVVFVDNVTVGSLESRRSAAEHVAAADAEFTSAAAVGVSFEERVAATDAAVAAAIDVVSSVCRGVSWGNRGSTHCFRFSGGIPTSGAAAVDAVDVISAATV